MRCFNIIKLYLNLCCPGGLGNGRAGCRSSFHATSAGAHLKKMSRPRRTHLAADLQRGPKTISSSFTKSNHLSLRTLNQVCQSLQTDLIWNFTIVVLPFLSQFLFSQKRPFIRRRLVVGRMKGAWYIFAPFHVQKLPVSSMCQIFLFCKCYEMEWLFR